MPLFICRWQSGDFSAVSASSRAEALEVLDEVGNADVADVFKAKRFMVHFQLKKQINNVEDPALADRTMFPNRRPMFTCIGLVAKGRKGGRKKLGVLVQRFKYVSCEPLTVNIQRDT